MTTEKYNGWTNYETWNYALWLDNDEGSQGYWTGEAETIFENAEADKSFTKAERATLNLADQIKEECELRAEEWMPKQSGPFADAVNAYIGSINWYEIAAHYVGEIETEQAA